VLILTEAGSIGAVAMTGTWMIGVLLGSFMLTKLSPLSGTRTGKSWRTPICWRSRWHGFNLRRGRLRRHSLELDINRAVLTDLDRRKRRREKPYEMDVILLEDFRVKIMVVRHQVPEVQKDIDAVEQRLAAVKSDNAAMLGLQEAVQRVRENLGGLAFQEKRLALQALDIRVLRVGKEQREITGQIPVETCPDTCSGSGEWADRG